MYFLYYVSVAATMGERERERKKEIISYLFSVKSRVAESVNLYHGGVAIVRTGHTILNGSLFKNTKMDLVPGSFHSCNK